jgi:hypothetical protein
MPQLSQVVPHFRVGDRVLCVDASSPRLAPRAKPLIRGRIYVVRAIDLAGWSPPGWGVHLAEIWIWYPGDGGGEWAIHPRRFRLVEERPTDIEPLRKLLVVEPEPKR